MEYKYALVEDNIDFYHIFKKEASLFLKNVVLDYYDKPKYFLELCKDGKYYDVIFLDIDMPEVDGITLSKNLYSFNHDSIIVFLTNKNELVFEAFGLNVFSFIPKSEFHQRKTKLFNDLNDYLLRNAPIRIVNAGDQYSLNRNDIIYAEKIGKDIIIYTKELQISLKRTTMEYLFHILETRNFQYANRSTIVNLKYALKITKNSILLSHINKTVDISRGKYKELYNIYLKL